eukprot:scaffold233727_cov21-Tisochrysis_lutea.AAC.2
MCAHQLPGWALMRKHLAHSPGPPVKCTGTLFGQAAATRGRPGGHWRPPAGQVCKWKGRGVFQKTQRCLSYGWLNHIWTAFFELGTHNIV